MVYPLVARPLRVKISELIGDIPALLVHEFLDLEAVVPPERLRWSKALGRPWMSPADDDENAMGPVWISEILDEDTRVGGNCVQNDLLVFMCRPVRLLPPRCRNMDNFWGVYIYSDGDRGFNANWLEKHGRRWPFVVGGVHPALRSLYNQYLDFERAWSEHADDSDFGFHEYRHQQRLDDFDQILMEAQRTGSLREVVERFPMSFV